MTKFKLKRTVQCAKCPWKVATNPHDIPDGYCELKHANLADTIAKEGEINLSGTMKVMACHHSKDDDMQHCVGWVHNQLGPGNNIGLRMQMMSCENIRDLKIVGKQHERFEDTLPKHALNFPKRNTRFKLEDFFQVAVDDFHSGEFLFLSAKKVKTKSDERLLDDVESFDEYGWVISTWCYDRKYYYKIFVCQYRQKAWKNHYHIESLLAGLNGCDGYAVNDTIEEFVDWMDCLTKK